MKDDVGPLPERPPAKRRQLQQTPALWIAQWLAGDTLTPSERRRLEEEKHRRRGLTPDRAVGIVVGAEGVTPEQFTRLIEQTHAVQPTEIHHPGLQSRLHMQLRAMEVPVHVHAGDFKAVVKASHVVILAPRDSDPSGRAAVWETLRYAKHRNLAVRVVLPSGDLGEGSC